MPLALNGAQLLLRGLPAANSGQDFALWISNLMGIPEENGTPFGGLQNADGDGLIGHQNTTTVGVLMVHGCGCLILCPRSQRRVRTFITLNPPRWGANEVSWWVGASFGSGTRRFRWTPWLACQLAFSLNVFCPIVYMTLFCPLFLRLETSPVADDGQEQLQLILAKNLLEISRKMRRLFANISCS